MKTAQLGACIVYDEFTLGGSEPAAVALQASIGYRQLINPLMGAVRVGGRTGNPISSEHPGVRTRGVRNPGIRFERHCGKCCRSGRADGAMEEILIALVIDSLIQREPLVFHFEVDKRFPSEVVCRIRRSGIGIGLSEYYLGRPLVLRVVDHQGIVGFIEACGIRILVDQLVEADFQHIPRPVTITAVNRMLCPISGGQHDFRQIV